MKLSKLNQLIDPSTSLRAGDGEEIKGRWEITPDHEIQYKKIGQDEEIKARGSLVATEPDALVISVTERQTDQTVVTSIYKLIGSWKANPKNQLVFEVEKEQGKNDVLTFRERWKINSQHEIVYAYKQASLKTKKKESRELNFQGYWDVTDKNRLTYFIGGDSESAFRFRGAFQTKSIHAKKNEIRYQLGVEVAGKHKVQTIALFGKWKVSRDLALDFEIEYEDGARAIAFGGEYALGDDSTVEVNLKSQEGKPLGVELILTKDVFGKDGQAFVRLQKSLEESRVEVGVRVKW
jgi:hypothetical protein